VAHETRTRQISAPTAPFQALTCYLFRFLRGPHVERFNGSFRRELLNGYLFTTLRQVREHCQLWQYDYNHLRPHQALNFMTPIEFRQAA